MTRKPAQKRKASDEEKSAITGSEADSMGTGNADGQDPGASGAVPRQTAADPFAPADRETLHGTASQPADANLLGSAPLAASGAGDSSDEIKDPEMGAAGNSVLGEASDEEKPAGQQPEEVDQAQLAGNRAPEGSELRPGDGVQTKPAGNAELSAGLQSDILIIDAVSFAARAGQVVAAEIYMLLTGCEPENATVWFRSGDLPFQPDHRTFAAVEEQLIDLAAYVCKRRTDDGERLRNYALQQDFGVTPLHGWTDVGLAEQQAWTLFARTCLCVFAAIDAAQVAERQARAIEAAPANPPIAREDSIFEEHASLGETIPGVLEAMARTDGARDHRLRLAQEEARKAQAAAEGWEVKRMPKPVPG